MPSGGAASLGREKLASQAINQGCQLRGQRLSFCIQLADARWVGFGGRIRTAALGTDSGNAGATLPVGSGSARGAGIGRLFLRAIESFGDMHARLHPEQDPPAEARHDTYSMALAPPAVFRPYHIHPWSCPQAVCPDECYCGPGSSCCDYSLGLLLLWVTSTALGCYVGTERSSLVRQTRRKKTERAIRPSRMPSHNPKISSNSVGTHSSTAIHWRQRADDSKPMLENRHRST